MKSQGIGTGMRVLSAALMLGAALFVSGPASAQNVTTFQGKKPSSDELIKALTPDSTFRGVRPISPSPGAAAAPAAAAPPPPSSGPAVALDVRFHTGSAELTPEARDTLDQLGAALNSTELRGYGFRVEGHTDTVGSAEYNQALSERRAASVKQYLVSRHGVTPDRLDTVGKGENEPLVRTPDGTPEARNRRVQVVTKL